MSLSFTLLIHHYEHIYHSHPNPIIILIITHTPSLPTASHPSIIINFIISITMLHHLPIPINITSSTHIPHPKNFYHHHHSQFNQ
jgi:hypothetical protein